MRASRGAGVIVPTHAVAFRRAAAPHRRGVRPARGDRARVLEHEPLVVTEGFHTRLPRAAECDRTVVVLRARLGARLPAPVTRPDGSRHASGTELELEDARAG